MVDEVVAGLDKRGHPGVRPGHEFALRAIDNGAENASELARRLSVSRQAAAKTIAALLEMGYVARDDDPDDRRRKRLHVTKRGHEMMSIGAGLFDDVRKRWAARIGRQQLEALEASLAELVPRQVWTAEDLTSTDVDSPD